MCFCLLFDISNVLFLYWNTNIQSLLKESGFFEMFQVEQHLNDQTVISRDDSAAHGAFHGANGTDLAESY